MNYLVVFRVVGTAAFLAYGLGNLSNGIWKGQPWSVVIKESFDGLIYGLAHRGNFWLALAPLVFACFGGSVCKPDTATRPLYRFPGPTNAFPGNVFGTSLPWSISTVPPTITNCIPALVSMGDL